MSIEYNDMDNELIRLIKAEFGLCNVDEYLNEAKHSLNDLMSDLDDMISMALNLEKSDDMEIRSKYLRPAFSLASDACWIYIKDILHDPEIDQEKAEKIIDNLLKYTAFSVAMIIAIDSRNDRNEDGGT